MQEKYFIGISLPKNIANQIDEWRKKYYFNGYKIVPAHITLVPPFMLSEKEEVLSKIINQKIKCVKSFDLIIESFGSFTGQHSVFFANIKPSPDITLLHASLLTPVQAISRSFIPTYTTYIPHITIANRLSHGRLKAIQDEMIGQKFSPTFNVSEIILYKRTNNSPYFPVRQYTLDKVDILRYHPKADLRNGQSEINQSSA